MPAQTQKQNDRNPFEGLIDDEEIRYTRKTTRTTTHSTVKKRSTRNKKPKESHTGKYILIGCMCVVALAANRIIFHSDGYSINSSQPKRIEVEAMNVPISPITGEFTLDGTDYEELTPIQNFLDNGWIIDDDYGYIDSEGYIETGQSVHLVMKKGYSQSFEIYAEGFEEQADKINVEDVYVTGLSVNSNSNVDFVTSIGISSGMSEDEVIQILTDSGNGYHMNEYTYKYSKETEVNHYYYSTRDFDGGWYDLEVSFRNGEMNDLEQWVYYYDPPNLN